MYSSEPYAVEAVSNLGVQNPYSFEAENNTKSRELFDKILSKFVPLSETTWTYPCCGHKETMEKIPASSVDCPRCVSGFRVYVKETGSVHLVEREGYENIYTCRGWFSGSITLEALQEKMKSLCLEEACASIPMRVHLIWSFQETYNTLMTIMYYVFHDWHQGVPSSGYCPSSNYYAHRPFGDAEVEYLKKEGLMELVQEVLLIRFLHTQSLILYNMQNIILRMQSGGNALSGNLCNL